MSNEQTTREHYRVEIPRAEFVSLVTRRAEYRVVELSERGIQFEISVDDMDSFKFDDIVSGKLHYGQEDSIAIRGTVLRVDPFDSAENLLVIASISSLSTNQLIQLQSYLIRKYGQ
jgi:CYTH domain-containing protein